MTATTKTAVSDTAAVQAAWATLERSVGPLAAIRSKREYERKRKLMNALLDEIGGDERHPLASLLDLVGELVAAFEAREGLFPRFLVPLGGRTTLVVGLGVLMRKRG